MLFMRVNKYFKGFILALLLVFATVSAVGCGTKNDVDISKKPLKVGLLVPYSGVFASNGYDITRGVELYLDEIGWKAGGREIKLIKEDSEMNGQVGLQKTRRLVEAEKIDVLTGVVSSTVATAIRDYVVAKKLPFVIANAGAVELTGTKGSKYIFRVSFSNGQYEYPMGTYAYQKLGYRQIVVMAPDYVTGREKAQGFIEGFEDAGGQIVQEIYPKLGTSDFGPYLTQVKEADAVFAHFSGSDSLSFVKQYDEFGLKKKMPLLSTGDLLDESFLPSQGDSTLGILSSLHYCASLETPENKSFYENYKKKYNEEPTMFSEQGYVAIKVIAEGAEKVKGNTRETEKYLEAIREVKFQAPRGPFRFDPKTQNVIFHVYVRRVEKKDGKLINKVIETIPDVAKR